MKFIVALAVGLGIVGSAVAAPGGDGWYVIDPSTDARCLSLAQYAQSFDVATPPNPTPAQFVHIAVALGAPLVNLNRAAGRAAVNDRAGNTIGFVRGRERCLSWVFRQMKR